MTKRRVDALALIWTAAVVTAMAVMPMGQALAASAGETAAEKPAGPASGKAAKDKKAGKPASKAKIPMDSSEKPADRRARLQRECRGAVNAGVCTGYTN
jgi:hypothetical protein